MNIKELKAAIQDLPDEMPVAYYDNEYGEYWEASAEVAELGVGSPGVWHGPEYYLRPTKQTVFTIL